MPAVGQYRDAVIHGLYKGLLKPIFFRSDPEKVHDHMTKFGVMLGRHDLGRALTGKIFGYRDLILEQDVLGIHFRNPIGLSAGFDKNAELTDILPSVGFGFAEVGSITGNVCAGNPKPRLWRLPKSESLVVYYGLKNDGCEAIARRLRGKKFRMPIGVSVAMTNCAENLDLDKGIADFTKAFQTMEPLASYITVNISCPNTQGGQPFLAHEKLEPLLAALDRIPTDKPICIKLSPDLNQAQADLLLDVARRHRVQGIITSNLTKKRVSPRVIDAGVPDVGGLSGKAVRDTADDMLAHIRRREGNRFVLIGSGGVFTAEDAYRKIRLGASLVQMITGMIFEGPQVIGQINRGLAALLRRDGFTDISQAVGVDTC